MPFAKCQFACSMNLISAAEAAAAAAGASAGGGRGRGLGEVARVAVGLAASLHSQQLIAAGRRRYAHSTAHH